MNSDGGTPTLSTMPIRQVASNSSVAQRQSSWSTSMGPAPSLCQQKVDLCCWPQLTGHCHWEGRDSLGDASALFAFL